MRKFNEVTYFQNITPYLDHRNFCELKELGKHTLQRARLTSAWIGVLVYVP